MGEVKFSVILPVYNAEKYLARAIESVLAQDESDFELIIVDDGSEDESQEIMKHYAEKDSRIKWIERKNGGPLAAIRSGMQFVKGEYVAFIDADDEYHTRYLSEMYRRLSECDADIAVCGYYHRAEGKDTELQVCQNDMVYERKEIQESLVGSFLSDRKLLGARWNKGFRREILERAVRKITQDFSYGEDVVMVLGTFLEASRIAVSEQCLYFYYDTAQSLEKRMSAIERKIESAEVMYRNEMEMLESYERIDLLPCASYYHYTEVVVYLRKIVKSSLRYSEQKKRIKAVLENRTTRHALQHAKKKTWKSHVVIWLMKRRWIGTLALLLKIV